MSPSREQPTVIRRKPARSIAVFCWFSALSILLSVSTATSSEPVDAEHLLFLADHGLAVIQLQIDIDGQSQRELFRDGVLENCQTADRDHDGFLTFEDYEALLANHPRFQVQPARQMPRPNATPDRPEFGASGKLSVDDVAAYLLRTVWPPLRLEFTAPQMRRISNSGELLDRPLADSQLFERLDTDGNRKLTSRELERAGDVLAKLDFDEDELISLDELRMQAIPTAQPAANRTARKSDSHLSHLVPDRINAEFVRRILALYDGEAKDSVKDLRLTRQELGLSETLFAPSDEDQNGFWDFDELWRFLEQPTPLYQVSVHLNTQGRATVVEAVSSDDAAARPSQQQPGLVNFEIHGTRLQWNLPAGIPNFQQKKHAWETNFQQLDADRNGYLTPSEFQPGSDDGQPPNPMFEAMDSNGDVKVDQEELLAYFSQTLKIQGSQIVLRVENLERTLFGPLDLNSDGQLSARELKGITARLAEWDVDGDGKLTESEIPQQYRLRMFIKDSTESSAVGISPDDDEPQSDPIPAGTPVWFQKMDRNRDGEVSKREFLGTAAQFEKIDANADAAIDAAEAGKVK